MHQQEHPIEYEIQFVGPPYKQVVGFNSHLLTELNRNITYIFLMITDQPHYKSLSGEIQLALFYWTFPMNIFTPFVQHSCFSLQTVVKEPWRITDHQCGSSITTSVKTPFLSTQRWIYYPVTLLAPIGLWSLLPVHKKHNDHFINHIAVSLTHSWTSSPWLHTYSLYTLTTIIFTVIYHSYIYSLWNKTPTTASLLPLTWPRWGRGQRWLVNDDPPSFIKRKWQYFNSSTWGRISSPNWGPWPEYWRCQVSSQPSWRSWPDEASRTPNPTKSRDTILTPPHPPLITSLCIENLAVMSRFSVNGQTWALTENESTHNRQCGPTSNTEMPLKVKSMQLDTNNHQTSDWTNREMCTFSHASGDQFDYLH